MNSIEKISASIEVDLFNMLEFSEKDFASEIKLRLSNELAKYIYENMDKLPVKLIKITEIMVEKHKYTITANLISDDELERLRYIEQLYTTINTSITR